MFKPLSLVTLLIPSLCGFAQSSIRHGTAIAIERTNDEIAIAADSRVVDENNVITPDTCKIRSSGKWYFTLNGLGSTKTLDVFSVVNQIVSQGVDLASISREIVHTLTPALNVAMQSDPSLRKMERDMHFLLGVSIVGVEQDQLKLTSIRFTAANERVRHEEHMCPGAGCTLNRAAMLVPSYDSDRFDWSMEPIIAVRKFVQMEVERNAIDIGPPIQLLRINRKGDAVWIERPEICKREK